MAEAILGYDRIRIVNRVTGAEVVSNLAHLHQGSWVKRAMQQGSPGSVAIGDFTIKLHPPGSEGYAANSADYNKLLPGSGEGLRVEAFLGDGAILATPSNGRAGIITQVNLQDGGNSVFELIGKTDEWIAQAQRTYPGEIIHGTAYDTVSIVKEFIGNHAVGITDQFNPYVSGNYTSSNLPALTAGTWTGTTDTNGINSNVVTNSTGTGAVLISKTSMNFGVDADANGTMIAECICRLKPSGTSATNAGRVGIGLSKVAGNTADCQVAYVTAKWNAGTSRYDLDAEIDVYVGNVSAGTTVYTNVLSSVDDPDGYIPLQLQLLNQIGGSNTVRFIVNGSPVSTVGTGTILGFFPVFPMFMYGLPAAGGANAYFTNLLTAVRNTGGTTAWFNNGVFGTPAHKFRVNQMPPPTFLDMWTVAATLEGWYWRYTPATMSSGVAKIGVVDFNTVGAIGTDHSGDIRFVKGDNLVSIRQQGNADTFGSDLQLNGYADASSGGIHYGRNLSAMTTYGWLSGVGMTLSVQDYVGLQRQAAQVAANKGTPGGSYIAVVNRDPATADKFRELDYITVHDPEIGINNLKVLVLSITFDEGQPTQTLTLGQYGVADLVSAQRMMPGLNQMAGLFKNR